jgi:hypothetical protein
MNILEQARYAPTESAPDIVSFGEVLGEQLEYSEIEKFATWAFGSEASFLVDGVEFIEAWNRLHGKEFKVYGEDMVIPTTLKMIALWVQNRT